MLAFGAQQHQGETKGDYFVLMHKTCTVKRAYFYLPSQFVEISLDCESHLKNQQLFLAFHSPGQWCGPSWSPRCAVQSQVTDLGEKR